MKKVIKLKKDSIDNKVGQIISELRKTCNKTQADLARSMSVSTSTISHYEQGVTPPSLSQLCAFADYFGVNLDYLAGRCDFSQEYAVLKSTFWDDMTYSELLDEISKLPREKKAFLYKTLLLLKSGNL